MDNSQSSDVFSENEDFPCGTQPESETNETLIANTKLLLSKNIQKDVPKSSASLYISSAINKCKCCISQSLDQVIGLLSVEEIQSKVNVSQICNFLEDAVSILKLLCSFIMSVLESVTMTCAGMKNFPTDTGTIILTVFSHCKDSESIYGYHLRLAENQLKDLFRSCHELQLTYLMVLEKHFIFDLTESEHLHVLVEALEINLHIGEIVQTLDVKTMAEQWKAYTMICEKYSDPLTDRQIFDSCTTVLCKMMENNITIAMESNQDDKIMIRSLKVASFTIKILLRVCNIFRQSTKKNYDHILKLLLDIYQYNPSYLELSEGKSVQCLNSINRLIFIPIETLLNDLLLDEKFFNNLSKVRIENLEGTKQLSYILLIVSAIKCYTVSKVPSNCKNGIIESVLKWLPCGHTWFNLGLKFKPGDTTFGLYEHLLEHTFALTCTLNSEEMRFMERKMYESVLGLDCYCALFSTNLWELLAKSSPRPFIFNQMMSLCNIYKKLESHDMFGKYPQKVHLSKLIGRLYKTLHIDDKKKILKQFDVNKEKHFGLWIALRLESFASESTFHISEEIENKIRQDLKEKFYLLHHSNMCSSDMESLITLMKLMATGLNVEPDITLQNYLMQAWTYLCTKHNGFSLNTVMNQDSVWYFEYIEALVDLTLALRYVFSQSDCVVKVIHVMDTMIESGPTELKLVLIKLLFNTIQRTEDKNKQQILGLQLKIFKKLLQGSDNFLKSKTYDEIRKLNDNEELKEIISELSQDESLRQPLKMLTQYKSPKMNVKNQLSSTLYFNYSHKCLEKHVDNGTIILSDSGTIVKSNSNASNNFDFVDIDNLFETETDSEPARKRVKLESHEYEEIIKRLEKETSLLTNVKENISSEYKIRIRDICERLLNIID